jgi:hypothetical protein
MYLSMVYDRFLDRCHPLQAPCVPFKNCGYLRGYWLFLLHNYRSLVSLNMETFVELSHHFITLIFCCFRFFNLRRGCLLLLLRNVLKLVRPDVYASVGRHYLRKGWFIFLSRRSHKVIVPSLTIIPSCLYNRLNFTLINPFCPWVTGYQLIISATFLLLRIILICLSFEGCFLLDLFDFLVRSIDVTLQTFTLPKRVLGLFIESFLKDLVSLRIYFSYFLLMLIVHENLQSRGVSFLKLIFYPSIRSWKLFRPKSGSFMQVGFSFNLVLRGDQILSFSMVHTFIVLFTFFKISRLLEVLNDLFPL